MRREPLEDAPAPIKNMKLGIMILLEELENSMT
jgi:hypothetical protein